MIQWIAVPKCPSCGAPMRPDDEEDLWQCLECNLMGTPLDLESLSVDDDEYVI